MMMMMPSTLSIHVLLITSIALFSAPTVRSDANPIRLPTLDHNNNNNDDDDDACGEWSRRSPVSSCPVKCFRPDPVCGVDGVTYWCGCDDARCAGTKVTKKGFCEVGNNGAAAQALLLVHIVWLIVLEFELRIPQALLSKGSWRFHFAGATIHIVLRTLSLENNYSGSILQNHPAYPMLVGENLSLHRS
ncbi:hypothetical protein H0E87_026369 [Populus deltoides]|uniref:Serine protease inhibitor, Kazal-type family protein n=1 Tax=Populus deltoides TaxID=3696 RepID=A0A8T2X5V0_POPDE|nr:hypothetical protein H0E87_026369 [Populus deltoides]